MKEIFPAYYGSFRCTAGACLDNCCVGWDVVVDEEAFEKYNALEGPLGRTLREAMHVDDDGDRIFAMKQGRRPFLNEERLCELVIRLGPQALCSTCRRFPRILQDYGAFAEHDLSLACPEAARLILTTDPAPMEARGVPGLWPRELNGDLMKRLLGSREVLLGFLKDPLPFRAQLFRCLDYARWLQDVLDGETAAPFAPATPPAPEAPGALAPLLDFYLGLELLTKDWQTILENARRQPPCPRDYEALEPWLAAHEKELSRWVSHFIRQYFLQAVSDGDVLTRILMLLSAWALLRGLLAAALRDQGGLSTGDLVRLIQLYAKEVDHDEDNQLSLEEAIWDDPACSCENLLPLL